MTQPTIFETEQPKLNGKWPTGTFLQRRLALVRAREIGATIITEVKEDQADASE